MPACLRPILLSSVIALALALPVAAPAQHAHGAHQHGVAELTVVLEGRMLYLELISPLDNLVGFEHAPANETQRGALADAERLLLDSEAVFALPPEAGCVIREVGIESPWRDSGREHSHGQTRDHNRPRAIAPSCHNPKQLGAKFVDRRRQHALGLDARLAGRVEPQQVHHDVANDGEIVGSVAGANA